MTSVSILLGAVVLVVHLITAVPSYGCPFSGVAYSVGVGDPIYWSIPPQRDYYTNWSISRYFKIGDTLVFNFEGGLSNVVQVTNQDYESCTASKPLKIFNGGPANFTLQEKGVMYFITNVSNYCNLGQKISILVHECACPATEPQPSAPSVSPTNSISSPNTSQPPMAHPPVEAPAPVAYNASSPQPPHPAVESAASVLGVLHAILFGFAAFAFFTI